MIGSKCKTRALQNVKKNSFKNIGKNASTEIQIFGWLSNSKVLNRAAVVTGTLSWLFLVFTNFGAFIQYLAECKVTNTDTSHHRRQSPNLF